MMKWYVCLCLFFLSGCSSKYSDFFPYHNDGTPKPTVAFLPMHEASIHKPSWDVATEFTNAIRYRMMREGNLYVLSQKKDIFQESSFASSQELISQENIDFFKKYSPSQYVVFTELIDYEIIPYKRGQVKPLYVAHVADEEQAQILMIKIRLWIIDIHGEKVRLARSELIESNHVIEKGAMAEVIRLRGSPEYASSAIGIIHARVTRDIVRRINSTCCRWR